MGKARKALPRSAGRYDRLVCGQICSSRKSLRATSASEQQQPTGIPIPPPRASVIGRSLQLKPWHRTHLIGAARRLWRERREREIGLLRPYLVEMCPSSLRTNLLVERLSLNRSQCGGCSTKYDTPTES